MGHRDMAHGAAVARRVLALDWPRNVLVNVNFPDVVAASVRGVRVTHTGTRGFGGHIVERKDPRGGTYYWIGYAPQESEIDEASDIAAVRSGHISVTPLHLDLTHYACAARSSRTSRRHPSNSTEAKRERSRHAAPDRRAGEIRASRTRTCWRPSPRSIASAS